MPSFEAVSSLLERHDAAMVDLDGVVYVSGGAIDHAADAIAAARAAGLRVGFVTNNASRTTATVAANLTKLGVPCTAEDVVSSPQAATRMLVDAYGVGAPVIALGGKGLHAALAEGGLQVAEVDALDAVAVVTGYGPDVIWKDIMQVAVRIRDGLPWVATNTDASIPTAFGVAPGHGVMVKMLSEFAGVSPRVAGKPATPLLEETIRRLHAARPVMVGDRLDTDIEGANAIGMNSLLVLTGVSTWRELCEAEPHLRPTYVALDLRGLIEPHDGVDWSGERAHCGGWSAEVRDATLVVNGSGSPVNWVRAAAAASWRYADTAGQTPSFEEVAPPVVGTGR